MFVNGNTDLIIGVSNDSESFGTEVHRITARPLNWTTEDIIFMATSNYKYITIRTDSTKLGTFFIDNLRMAQASGISNINEMIEKPKIYNLEGVYLGTDYLILPEGLYVINRKLIYKTIK
jgi:hypothetical protein